MKFAQTAAALAVFSTGVAEAEHMETLSLLDKAQTPYEAQVKEYLHGMMRNPQRAS